MDFKKFYYIDEKGNIFWPGRIRLEYYIKGKCKISKSRASWCYGVPGIARSIYLEGQAIGDEESIDIAVKAIEGICNMEEEEWKIHTPIVCHGSAGMLAVVQAMYRDTQNPIFNLGAKKY